MKRAVAPRKRAMHTQAHPQRVLLVTRGKLGIHALPSARSAGSRQTKEDQLMAEALKIEDLKPGTGDEAVAGKQVTVHYVGTLTDGTKFDSSRDRGKGFSFRLGSGQVIKGWDQGVAGMKVGGLRKLTIPSDLAYGDRGFPPVIPPRATLVFEVELLSIS
jgi:FKBP-type peptidyl-prolyl cis-trans isomerase FkpA